jgi:hypothetical protein
MFLQQKCAEQQGEREERNRRALAAALSTPRCPPCRLRACRPYRLLPCLRPLSVFVYRRLRRVCLLRRGSEQRISTRATNSELMQSVSRLRSYSEHCMPSCSVTLCVSATPSAAVLAKQLSPCIRLSMSAASTLPAAAEHAPFKLRHLFIDRAVRRCLLACADREIAHAKGDFVSSTFSIRSYAV